MSPIALVVAIFVLIVLVILWVFSPVNPIYKKIFGYLFLVSSIVLYVAVKCTTAQDFPTTLEAFGLFLAGVMAFGAPPRE